MGLWKRVTEKARQAVGVKATASDWKPTSNARNLAMIDEAKKFSKQLKVLHKELRDLESRIEGNFSVLKSVLNAPLPRAYEMTDKGPVPVEREAVIVGAGVSFDTLTAAIQDLKAKLQGQVLEPLNTWQSCYKTIKVRNIKCEELRLELDAKRREALDMAATLERQKARASEAAAKAQPQTDAHPAAAGPTGAPDYYKFEDADAKLQKEQDKVTRLTQRYTALEEEVFSALLALINDTKVLKTYAASALVVYQDTFAHAFTAFGAPYPGVHAPSPTGGSPVKPAPSLEAPVAASFDAGHMTQSASMSTGGDPTACPGTPLPPPPPPPSLPLSTGPAPPAPPAWYNEARQNAATMRYNDSDDEA